MTQPQGPTDNSPEADSIYRTPESDTRFTPEGDMLAAYVGDKEAAYYAAQFDRFKGGGSPLSWNWPAFFISSWWLLYRKMWLLALLYWIVIPVVLGVMAAAVAVSMGEMASTLIYYGLYALIGFVALPVFANRLYYGHALAKVNKVAARTTSPEQQAAELARIGGTSSIVLVILPILLVMMVGILAAIAIPAYQDYTIRAQVSEGLNLSGGAKAAVAEYYHDNGVLPADNTQSGLPDPSQLAGTYVAAVEVADGEIVVTYGNSAHGVISGQILVLTPAQEPQGSLRWTCYAPQIANKHLPAACRN